MTPENPYEDFFESSGDQPKRKDTAKEQPNELPEEENIFEENGLTIRWLPERNQQTVFE